MSTHQRGFTIIGLMIVVAIIGILFGLAFTFWENVQERAQIGAFRTNLMYSRFGVEGVSIASLAGGVYRFTILFPPKQCGKTLDEVRSMVVARGSKGFAFEGWRALDCAVTFIVKVT